MKSQTTAQVTMRQKKVITRIWRDKIKTIVLHKTDDENKSLFLQNSMVLVSFYWQKLALNPPLQRTAQTLLPVNSTSINCSNHTNKAINNTIVRLETTNLRTSITETIKV